MNTNTDIRCFEAALQMLKYNIDVSQIAQDLFQSRTLESFEIEKVVLQNLFVDKKNRFALSFITSDDYKKYNATKDDSDASINLLRELACVDVACILRQEKDGEKIHGSLRSKTKTDVSMLAKKHVGGGHRAAAGFTMETSDIQEAIEIVKAQLCDLMQG
ncbi:MAG: DHHA1 domain-containing protein [Clostridia bacterium]|nr:DHHA1 domain-containing protein [Clostridia bacterium]